MKAISKKPKIIIGKYRGAVIATLIVLLWFANLTFSFQLSLDFANPMTYLLVLIQAHLFTGLFITAHDAMHGTVSSNSSINQFFGQLGCFLYAFFYLPKLNKLHHLHHKEVVGEDDPDFHDGGFLAWYFSFFSNYVGWINILGYAVVFNLLKLIVPTENLLVFWIIPAFISTFQLFYFGTYRPHKKENHHLPHAASSQNKNHLLAFLTCYFFGYHQEHHEHPSIPWWQLYKMK